MGLLKPYRRLVIALVFLTVVGNGLNLIIPKLVGRGVDSLTQAGSLPEELVWQFLTAGVVVFLFSYGQAIAQTVAAEKVARELRTKLALKISEHSYGAVETITPAKLLTNLTSDVDSVKLFVSQAVSTIISAVVMMIGTTALLLSIHWRLALAVLAIVPFIALSFRYVFTRVRALFMESQGAIDKLNRVINESILGSALIRILNAQQIEGDKFLEANAKARDIGLSILRLFAALIPVITLAMNIAVVTILALGGHFVIAGSMTLGDFTAFNTYLGLLVFPIMMIGFMSNVIAAAGASYARLGAVLMAPPVDARERSKAVLKGEIRVEGLTLDFGDKKTLNNVSFTVTPGTKTAIIGPTAAGKTQLLNVMIGLLKPTSGKVLYDGVPIEDYDPESLHRQVALVFQDSALFNLTLRENIAFSNDVSDASLDKALAAAELRGYVDALPQKLDTVVSERGTTLSGGQKQRVMLARALALDPKILLLDDFTARVDTNTEQAILRNVATSYPGITLISVTQKIASVEHYDQIILLMEGEVLAIGTHAELMHSSPEYVQVYNSQRSTSHYELHA